jgi:hypothetical protein
MNQETAGAGIHEVRNLAPARDRRTLVFFLEKTNFAAPI